LDPITYFGIISILYFSKENVTTPTNHLHDFLNLGGVQNIVEQNASLKLLMVMGGVLLFEFPIYAKVPHEVLKAFCALLSPTEVSLGG